MKLIALASGFLAAVAVAEVPKCAQLPKGKTRRYAAPKSIESGENSPAAVSFIVDNRGTLMSMFKVGTNLQMAANLKDGMWYLDTFSGSIDDYIMGQYFSAIKQEIVTMVRLGSDHAKQTYGDEFYGLYRDNTQRSVRVLKDILMNGSILDKVLAEEEYCEDLYAIAERDITEGAKVYQHFVKNHCEAFMPMTFLSSKALEKMRPVLDNKIMMVLDDEKIKGKFRQVVNEIPLVYQFFNDNIDFIEINNGEKELDDAVATDILLTLAEAEGNTQLESMINRNLKFIKKLMTTRALQQQKQKAIQKVMSKNKELMEAAWSEEEFNRLVEEGGHDKANLDSEMRNSIWNQVKINMKQYQDAQLDNNMEAAGEKSMKEELSRYERCVGILGLMPDELLESVAEMVQASCPELDLMDIDNVDMKTIFEQQDYKFIDQLIAELHQVCDMFGLVAEEKMMTKMVNGVEIQFYADDYLEGPKVEWE